MVLFLIISSAVVILKISSNHCVFCHVAGRIKFLILSAMKSY